MATLTNANTSDMNGNGHMDDDHDSDDDDTMGIVDDEAHRMAILQVIIVNFPTCSVSASIMMTANNRRN